MQIAMALPDEALGRTAIEQRASAVERRTGQFIEPFHAGRIEPRRMLPQLDKVFPYDPGHGPPPADARPRLRTTVERRPHLCELPPEGGGEFDLLCSIGRAPCRGRVCQYV